MATIQSFVQAIYPHFNDFSCNGTREGCFFFQLLNCNWPLFYFRTSLDRP